MTRTQWILTGALLVQLVLLTLIAAPWSSGSGFEGPRELLPELEAITPSRIEILDGDEALTLSQQAGHWQVEQAEGYPADTAKVESLLDDLRQLEVRRPVVTGRRYHQALEVSEDQNQRRIRVQDEAADDGELVLFLGSSPNHGVHHVRRADEDSVYEARGLSPWDLRAETASWIDTQLIDVAPGDLTSVKLSNAHGRFTLSRQEGSWVLEGDDAATMVLDASEVDAFVGSIGSLRFSEPAGRIDGDNVYGFDSPSATLELVYDIGGQESGALELVVGGEVDADAGTRYAHRKDSEFGVILAKAYAERLLEKKLEDLLVGSEDDETSTGDEAG